jgi:hypothetical protein
LWNKIGLPVVISLLFFIALPTVHVLAAPELKVDISVGLDEKAKYGKGAPLTVTIENTGSDFVGDLVLDLFESYAMGEGQVFPISLPSGETKVISLIIPRMDDSSNVHSGSPATKSVYFYENGWKNGKEISHKGVQKITSTLFYDDTKFLVTFTDNIDRLSMLKNVSISNYQNIQRIDGAKMGEMKIPDEGAGWGAADFIVVDEFALADYSVKKQEAFLEWIYQGGIVILGASDNSVAESGILAEYLPLKLNGPSMVQASSLNTFIGHEGFSGSAPSFSSELAKDAKVLLESKESTLIASKVVGKGLIIQTSFSLGDEPFSQMEGMAGLWNILLEEGNKVIEAANRAQQFMGNQNQMDTLVYTIGSSNELFPSFKVSTPLLVGIIFIYMILIIPVLYFILKRKDKREYAWWIIPIIAVLTSIGIFAYGAKDRMGPLQVQHSAVIDVSNDGTGTGYFVESLISNKSGSFSFNVPTGTRLTTSTQNQVFESSTVPIHKIAINEQDASGSTFHMRDVGFWSVATVYGEMSRKKIGKFESSLQVKEKKLTGNVVNGFPFGLTDVSIWSGSTLIPLGDMAAGETITVDKTLKYSTILPKASLNNTMNPMNQGTSKADNNDLEKMRKDSLLTFSGDQVNLSKQPVIIGFADTQVIEVDVNVAQSSVSSMTMLVQSVQPELVFGNSFTVEADMMTSEIVSEDGLYEPQPVGYVADQFYFTEPSYLQTWQLPSKLVGADMKWSELSVKKLNKKMYETLILNVKTGVFEESTNGKIEISSRIEDYISPKGEIVLQLKFVHSQDANETKAPQLQLTGEVKK